MPFFFLFSNRDLQFANCELGSGAVSDTVCETCPEGKYSDIDGEGSCTDCEAGRYSGTTGATSCSACEAGKASDIFGAGKESKRVQTLQRLASLVTYPGSAP